MQKRKCIYQREASTTDREREKELAINFIKCHRPRGNNEHSQAVRRTHSGCIHWSFTLFVNINTYMHDAKVPPTTAPTYEKTNYAQF